MIALHISMKSLSWPVLAIIALGISLALPVELRSIWVQKAAEDMLLRESRDKQEFVQMLYSESAAEQIADVSMTHRRDWEVGLCKSTRKLHFRVTEPEFEAFDSQLMNLNITEVSICLVGDSVAIILPLASMFLVAATCFALIVRSRIQSEKN